MKQQLTRSVVVIVMVTNTINILGPILVSRQAFDQFGTEGIAVITVILTLGTIIFSEIVPKALERTLCTVDLAAVSTRDSVGADGCFIRWSSCLPGCPSNSPRGLAASAPKNESGPWCELAVCAGYIETDEDQLIHRAFVLNDKTAGEIMTPLDRRQGAWASFTIDQAIAEVCRSGFHDTRSSVRRSDDVQGIVLSRDVLRRRARRNPPKSLASITRPAVIAEAAG